MQCLTCGGPTTSEPYPKTVAVDGHRYEMGLLAHTCPIHPGNFYTMDQWEQAENEVSLQLVADDRRGPQAIRWMTRGVFIDEFLIRFPELTPEQVKGWRKGEGEVPEEVIQLAYQVASTGIVSPCLCGLCIL